MSLAFGLDRASGEPLYRQVERHVRAAIETGRLRPGQRVPSVRTLASELDVGRLTVATAYEQLAADGYLVGRVGFGTIVAPTAVAGRWAGLGPVPRLGNGAATARETPVRRPPPDAPPTTLLRPTQAAQPRFDLRAAGVGHPALTVGPVLERLLREAWRDAGAGASTTPEPAGDPLLRAAIASHVRATRGSRCEASQVVVLSGAVIGISAIARLWLAGGTGMAVEDPGDASFFRVLSLAGVPLRPVPVDRNGARIEALPDAAVALVSPTVQAATGVGMPLARRLRLLAWAAEHGALVVEDSRVDDLALAPATTPALLGLDEDGRVVHIAGFASLLHPGVQLGYAVVPADLVDAFVATVSAVDPGATPVQQRAVGRFLADGHFDRHRRRVRRALADRFDALLDAVRRDLGWLVTAETPAGGTRAILVIEDEAWTASAVAAAALDAGVGVESLARSRISPGDDRELVVDVGRLEPAEIRRAVRLLAGTLADRRLRRVGAAEPGSTRRAPAPVADPVRPSSPPHSSPRAAAVGARGSVAIAVSRSGAS